MAKAKKADKSPRMTIPIPADLYERLRALSYKSRKSKLHYILQGLKVVLDRADRKTS